MGDAPGYITKVVVENSGIEINYYLDGKGIPIHTFDEMDESKIIVTAYYKTGPCIKYVCECVGQEEVNKRITRKTPILLSALGSSRFSHDEYVKDMKNNPLYKADVISSLIPYDGYYAIEDLECRFALVDMKRLFTLFQEDFYGDL